MITHLLVALASLVATATFAAPPIEGMRQVGVILSAPTPAELLGPTDPYAKAFADALRERGWVEGKNLRLHWRTIERSDDKIPAAVASLARIPVDVLVTSSNFGAVVSRDHPRLPVVIAAAYHPDEYKMVDSLQRPGGMVTGALIEPGRGINAKRIALLRETVPKLARIAYLSFPGMAQDVHDEVQRMAIDQGITAFPVFIREPRRFESAFEEASKGGAGALIVGSANTYLRPEVQSEIHALAIRHRLPVLHCLLAPGESGGLMAYATDLRENYRIAARQVDSILRGASAGQIPMEQPENYQLTVDLRAAKAIGLTVPDSVILQAHRLFK
jgi:putative ABC transport system substrate-binding protein